MIPLNQDYIFQCSPTTLPMNSFQKHTKLIVQNQTVHRFVNRKKTQDYS